MEYFEHSFLAPLYADIKKDFREAQRNKLSEWGLKSTFLMSYMATRGDAEGQRI